MATRIRFTDRTIAALPIPTNGKRADYADTETRGLRLRVSSNGIKTFNLVRRIKQGPVERLTLGRFDDIKTEQARRESQRLIGIIADGANPAEVKRAHKGEPTFAKLFAEYMERHARQKKRTWREDEQKYRDYLEKPLAKKKISRITRQDLAAIHSRLTAEGSPILANRVKDLVSSVFGRAMKWGYLNANPAKGIEDNPEISRDRFLQPGELPRLFAALAEEPNVTFRDFFTIALLTGARRANVRMMRWADLDLAQARWRIPMTKSGQPQDVPLVPEAVEILRERLKVPANNNAFVFPAARSDSKLGHMSGERKAWLRMLDRDELTQLRQRLESAGHAGALVPENGSKSPDTVTKALTRARRVAKQLRIKTDGARIEDVRIHDLRRTLGSWQARTGASMVIIGKSLGHKSQQATAVYARLDLDPVRESMERATSAMLVAAGEKAPADVSKLKEGRAKR